MDSADCVKHLTWAHEQLLQVGGTPRVGLEPTLNSEALILDMYALLRAIRIKVEDLTTIDYAPPSLFSDLVSTSSLAGQFDAHDKAIRALQDHAHRVDGVQRFCAEAWPDQHGCPPSALVLSREGDRLHRTIAKLIGEHRDTAQDIMRDTEQRLEELLPTLPTVTAWSIVELPQRAPPSPRRIALTGWVISAALIFVMKAFGVADLGAVEWPTLLLAVGLAVAPTLLWPRRARP